MHLAPGDALTYARGEAPPVFPVLMNSPHVQNLRSGHSSRAMVPRLLDSIVMPTGETSHGVLDLPASTVRFLETRSKASSLLKWDTATTKERVVAGVRCAEENPCGLVGCGRKVCFRASHNNKIRASRQSVTDAQLYADDRGLPLMLVTLNMQWAVPGYDNTGKSPVLSPGGGASNAPWLRSTWNKDDAFGGKNLLEERLTVIEAARNRFKRNFDGGPVWWWSETSWRESSVKGQRWLPQPHLHLLVATKDQEAVARAWEKCGDARVTTKKALFKEVRFGRETTQHLGRYLAKGSTGTHLARLQQGKLGGAAIRCSDLAAYLDDRSLLEWVASLDAFRLGAHSFGAWGAT